jgi:hypothetical protein
MVTYNAMCATTKCYNYVTLDHLPIARVILQLLLPASTHSHIRAEFADETLRFCIRFAIRFVRFVAFILDNDISVAFFWHCFVALEGCDCGVMWCVVVWCA